MFDMLILEFDRFGGYLEYVVLYCNFFIFLNMKYLISDVD